jgi:hypothetical protein
VGQRIVAVVALGAILLLAGAYLTAPVPFTGWTGYAPLQGVPALREIARDGLGPVQNLFVWFGLVLGWCAGSLLLLQGRRRGQGPPRSVPGESIGAGSPRAGG